MSVAALEVGARLLQDRIALVTAGASGMGGASARLFAQHGAHVVVVDRDAAAGERAVREIAAEGGSAEAHAVDVTDAAAVDALFAALTERHDRLDVLFNHAGAPAAPGLDFDAAALESCLALNLSAPIVFTQRALPLLRRSPAASVIFTASVSGLVASPFSPVYAAAKGGVVLFMKSIAVLLGPERIRANAICPGPTDTPMLPSFFGAARDDDPEMRRRLERFLESVPLGRLAAAEEVADLALFLASDASSYLTGNAVPVDGGLLAR